MVGVVVVSHSRDLATALVALARQAGNDTVPIASAGGVGEERSEFGTDAVQISEAIASVYSDDGVVVLMDLGSAILSSETALEMLDPEQTGKVRFCPAPIVEGTIAAYVQAGLGSDLDAVCREARGALVAKQQQLGEQPDDLAGAETGKANTGTTGTTGGSATTAASGASGERRSAADLPRASAELVVRTEHGLHARPAALLVRTVGRFNSKVRLTNITRSRGPVNAASVNRVATLGVRCDDTVAVEALGPDAEAVVAALRELSENRFGEPSQPASAEPTRAAPATAPEGREGPEGPAGDSSGVKARDASTAVGGASAVAVSEGVALGPLYRAEASLPEVGEERADDPDRELSRLRAAVEAVGNEIEERKQRMAAQTGGYEAAIFDAHELILQDPELLDRAQHAIETQRRSAATVWRSLIEELAAEYRELDDAYMQQRAGDVEDVGRQVLQRLLGAGNALQQLQPPQGSVLVAQELTPTETAALDLDIVAGIMTVAGGPTSHSAIIARALGIPAVAGIKPAVLEAPLGTELGLDADRACYWVRPSEAVRSELQKKRRAWVAERRELQALSREDAVTADGLRVLVVANIGSVRDAEPAVANGAEGVGLARSEFLFLDAQQAPSEDQQLEALREIGVVFGERPIILRTLDLGGDKQIPYLDLPREANPFLGVRGLRLSLKHPQLFRSQLRAVLRAAAAADYRVMFPMVADLADFQAARRALEEAHNELSSEGIPHRWPIPSGIMIETPAAVMQSEVLAREADFFSIGTNDLTQYSMAAERGNTDLARFADPLHPAILRMIACVTDSGARHQRLVGVCGELAGEPEAAPILVGLGVGELSLSAAGIPRIKRLLRSIKSSEAKDIAAQALSCVSAAEVRELTQGFLASLER